MTTMTNQERADRLLEIKDEMLELLDEARELVRGTSEEGRAEAYWLAHLRMALDADHDYLGSSMCTMHETVEALESDEDEEDDE